jgi:hypothetical protein
MHSGYSAVTGKASLLLKMVLEKFCGGAYVSFEGDLSQLNMRDLRDHSFTPTEVLKRNTLQPLLDFVIIPLDADTTEILLKRVLPRVGLRARVTHIQIEKEGKLLFGAYDNFDADCVWFHSSVGTEFLDSLVACAAIRKYTFRPAIDRSGT